ncbi:MAG: pseudouridine synthase [Lachnospiraceae bacterium]|nr:pseudouridine synthase [Candidatus Colinaster scatohippi]
MEKATRLNKFIAECGVCSRREADRLIETGKVTVNGVLASAGLQVTDSDRIIVNGKPVQRKNEKVVLAYYKPVGVTCTEKDKHAQVTVKDVLDYPVRVTYAGRLDKESEGLLLMTNDGDLINALMRGSNGHEKEYLVRVNKEIPKDFKGRMENGIYIADLDTTTRKCKVDIIDPYTFKIVLTQGLNRQIRRMCESLGLRVLGLKRIRIANIEIGKLRVGTYRKITGEELKELYNCL